MSHCAPLRIITRLGLQTIVILCEYNQDDNLNLSYSEALVGDPPTGIVVRCMAKRPSRLARTVASILSGEPLDVTNRSRVASKKTFFSNTFCGTKSNSNSEGRIPLTG